MCGRYTLYHTREEIEERFAAQLVPHLAADAQPRYNIAPTQTVLAVTEVCGGARLLDGFHWGLIPSWAKDGKSAFKMINARSETADTKPAYRRLLATAARRALLPADGFYEWLRSEDRRQSPQPFRFTVDDGAPFAMAGLWTPGWLDGEEVATVTILTCPANEVVGRLHDRMPVILPDRASELAWLDPELDGPTARTMCLPLAGARMRAAPANPAVNRTGKDLAEGPDLLTPPDSLPGI